MQYFVKASVFAALVASINALQVTAPAKNAEWDVSKSNTISWSSVDSDPSSFSIQLVNMAVNPSVTINVADNVQSSSGSYDMPAQKNVTPGGAYQINLVSKQPQNSGILAQSQQFSVEEAAASSSSSSAAASSASSSSSSASSASSSSASMASASASSAASSASASASSAASSASASASDAASSGSAAVTSATSSATAAASSGNAAASMHLATGAAGLGLVGAFVAMFA